MTLAPLCNSWIWQVRRVFYLEGLLSHLGDGHHSHLYREAVPAPLRLAVRDGSHSLGHRASNYRSLPEGLLLFFLVYTRKCLAWPKRQEAYAS